MSATFEAFRARLAAIQANAEQGERIALMILNEYRLGLWCGEAPDRALTSAEVDVRRAWEH